MKPTKEELERMYYDEKLSTTQIADKCEVHYSTILRWMRKSKMTARDYGTSRKLWCEKRMPSKEELERMYIQKRMSTCEIAKLYDVCQATIVNWLNKKGLKRQIKDWKNLEFALGQAKLFLQQHPEYSELPSSRILKRKGSRSLDAAIIKYFDSYSSFREKLREYMGQSQISSLLEQYVGGER